MFHSYFHSCFCIWEVLLCLNKNWAQNHEQCTYFKKYNGKKAKRFTCIQKVFCRNKIRSWCLVQGQLMKKWCQWNSRTRCRSVVAVWFWMTTSTVKFDWNYCHKSWISWCRLCFSKAPFSFMRSFYYYCCLSLIRAHVCFSFENDLLREKSKR